MDRKYDSRDPVGAVIYQLSGVFKAGALIVAALMLILGILFLARPFGTGLVLMVLATLGFLLYGIARIAIFFATPKELRSGWTLANGLIFVLFAILVLCDSRAEMMLTFSFILGFLAMFNGINKLCTCWLPCPIPKWWLAVNGVIDLLLGAFFLAAPYAALFSFDIVLGIYLILGGIAFAIELLTAHKPVRSDAA